MKPAAFALVVLAGANCQAQQPGDPNLAFPNEVVTVQRDGYTIAGLATHLEGSRFRYGIALFPGSPGILRITEENGRIRHEQVGNFLNRSRRQWLDEETLTLMVDAPSDQWHFFNQLFRATPRYGADVKALMDEVARRYGIEQWTFVGTSEGSVTAFHAARMNPGTAKRVILTSSVLLPSRNGPALASVDWSELSMPLLWVHHLDDSCRSTPYREAQRSAEKSHSPLVTVRGGGPYRGDPCEPYFPHGFVGREREVVLAMKSWVKTGKVPPDVGAP